MIQVFDPHCQPLTFLTSSGWKVQSMPPPSDMHKTNSPNWMLACLKTTRKQVLQLHDCPQILQDSQPTHLLAHGQCLVSLFHAHTDSGEQLIIILGVKPPITNSSFLFFPRLNSRCLTFLTLFIFCVVYCCVLNLLQSFYNFLQL